MATDSATPAVVQELPTDYASAMRASLFMISLVALLIPGLYDCCSAQDPATGIPEQVSTTQKLPLVDAQDTTEFRRAFEEAFDAGDSAAMTRLVKENPTRFVPLFIDFTRLWIECPGEITEIEVNSLAKARALAEAADEALAAPGLIEVIAAIEGFDDVDREAWRVAFAANARGRALYTSVRWNEALAPLTEACERFEQLGDSVHLARAANSLGLCYDDLGQQEKAIELLTRALELSEKIGNPQTIAASLNNLGSCYNSLGQYEKAIAHHARALELKEKIGNPQDIAFSLNNLGHCYEPLGQYEKAIAHHARALELTEKIGNPQDIAFSLNGLGNCYDSLGQFEKAIELHSRALDLKEKLANPQDIAGTLSNLGSCFGSFGQYEKAIEFLTRALELQEKLGNPLDIALSLNNLGNCFYSLGQYEKAIELHSRALELKEKIGNPQDIAASLNNLGSCYNSLGQYEKAIEHHSRSLEFKEKIGNPQDIASSLENLGCCYASVHRWEEALRSFERCVAALDLVGRRSFGEEARAEFTARWSKVTEHISLVVQGLSAIDGLERGFPLVEAFLSRTLLEGLQEHAESVAESEDPELATERTSVLNHMTEKRLALGKAVCETSLDSRDSPELESLRLQITQLESAFAEVERRLRAKNPKLGELLSPRPTSLDQAQATLGEDEALLLYVLGEKQSFVWVITNDTAALLPLAPESVLKVSYDQLHTALASDQNGHFRRDASFVSPARELFRQLLAPVAELLANARSLLIVPTGFLGFLPYEVLLTNDVKEEEAANVEKLPYLIHEKTLSYAPSASFLVWSREHGVRKEKAWRKDLCLFGDALYGEGESRTRARALLDVAKLQRLRLTRDEVVSVAENVIGADEAKLFLELKNLERSGMVSGARFDLFLGDEASRVNLCKDLTGYRILHLAVHGFFDPEFPWFSGLVLSGENDDARILKLADIATLKIHPELVFLSACETARGKELSSDGIKSTARSFLLAGAQAVVATQWTVYDDAANVVAQEFYDRALKGVAPALALREAKIALLRHEVSGRGVKQLEPSDREAMLVRYAHPSFWAPFVLWGN